MDEYIRRSDVLAQASFVHGRWDDTYVSSEKLKAITVADVAPVVHARWIIRFDGPYRRRRCYCSHCEKHNGIGGVAQNQEKPYCPNCGAKMDEGDDS